jgi:hypothetical protein
MIGTYRVHAEPWSNQGDRSSSSSLDETVPSGAREVVLRLRRGALLAGHVIDASTGDPLAAEVMLALGSEQEGLHFSTMTRTCDVKHGFRIEHLPAATYTLSARTTTGRAGFMRTLTLAPDEQRTDVQLRVESGATVNVRYEGPDPVGHILILSDGVATVMDVITKGTDRTFCVPAGRSIARMMLDPDGKSFDAGFDLKSGAKGDLVFDNGWK